MDIRTDNIDDVKALMANVLNGHNGENLYAYLSQFNHINVGYVADAVSARNAVPEIMRKPGMVITYYINEKPTIDQFVGTKDDAGDEETWVDDNNWNVIDGIAQVDTNSITLEQLSKEVIELIGNNENINIVNYPDGEDLTQYDACGGNGKNEINVLKFADKGYNSANHSGLGRKYLRKNLVEITDNDGNTSTINQLTQDMISDANTRYVIQYAYDLNGETITIPENCVLEFQGGSITNGEITCDNTVIVTYDKNWVGATLNGSYVFFGWADAVEQIEIVDNLTTNDSTKALSAAQGVILFSYIESLSASLIKVDEQVESYYQAIQKQITEINDKIANIDSGSDSSTDIDFDNITFNKINIADGGLIGSVVFKGNWIYSKNGVDASGADSDNYTAFDPEDPYGGDFRPFTAMNFVSGEIYFGGGRTHFDRSNAQFGLDPDDESSEAQFEYMSGVGNAGYGNIQWIKDGYLRVKNPVNDALTYVDETVEDVTYRTFTIPHINCTTESDYIAELSLPFTAKSDRTVSYRLALEDSNDVITGKGTIYQPTKDDPLTIDDKIPDAYGIIKFVGEINKNYNHWNMVVLEDANTQ